MDDLNTNGSGFDRLFEDGDRFAISALKVEVLRSPATPGRCRLFDRRGRVRWGYLFMPDYTTARADFRGGDARTLYRSIGRRLALSDETRLFLCHDHKTPGRDDYR